MLRSWPSFEPCFACGDIPRSPLASPPPLARKRSSRLTPGACENLDAVPASSGSSLLGALVASPLPLSLPLPSPAPGCRQLEVLGGCALRHPPLSVRLVSAPLWSVPSSSMQPFLRNGVSPSHCASFLAFRDVAVPALGLGFSSLASPLPPACGGSSSSSSPSCPSPLLLARAPCGPAPAVAWRAGALLGGEIAAAEERPLSWWHCAVRAVQARSILIWPSVPLQRNLTRLLREVVTPAWIRYKPPRRCRRSASP